MGKETKKLDVANIETAKANIESGKKEFTEREKVAAVLTLSAVTTYCNATKRSEDDVNEILDACKKSEYYFWVYTTPSLGDGKEKPTQQVWEKANPDAIKCDVLDSAQWYKKPVYLENAMTIVRIVSSYERYHEAIKNGREKYIKRLKSEISEAFLSGDMTLAQEKAAEVKKLESEK